MKMLIIKTNYLEEDMLSKIRYLYNINPINKKSISYEEE